MSHGIFHYFLFILVSFSLLTSLCYLTYFSILIHDAWIIDFLRNFNIFASKNCFVKIVKEVSTYSLLKAAGSSIYFLRVLLPLFPSFYHYLLNPTFTSVNCEKVRALLPSGRCNIVCIPLPYEGYSLLLRYLVK
jgi:hypothetical protein